MHERDITAEGSTLRGVVWVADGASMVRVSPSHLRTLSEAEKTLCTLKDTDVLQFQDMVRRLPNTTYLDLVDQPDQSTRSSKDRCPDSKILSAQGLSFQHPIVRVILHRLSQLQPQKIRSPCHRARAQSYLEVQLRFQPRLRLQFRPQHPPLTTRTRMLR